ncbi:MAG: hypothetical protein Q4A64_04720 [Porphyromonadaceae bacterium]|nr:hypothetical protein [Porphyromonadaceae bacterium]
MKFIKIVGACLIGISLVACQDKFQHIDDPLPKPEPNTNNSLEKDYVPFFESDVLLSEEDQLRSIDLEFDRAQSDDKAKLSFPRLKFVKDQEIGADIILRREKGGQVDFIRERGQAQFISVDPKGRSGRVRFWLKKENPKKNESLFTFESDETWHAMFILDAEASITQENGQDIALFGETPSDRDNLSASSSDEDVIAFVGNNQTAGTGAAREPRKAESAKWAGHNGFSYSTGKQEIPLISNWKQLEIKTGATSSDSPIITDKPNVLVRLAKNVTFKIKPQGLLLNYQITANVYEGIDMRRAGIISNVFDFQGKYKLDKASLETAFNKKGSNTDGFGIPDWVPIKSKLLEAQKLKMYKPSASDLNCGYPWDMPMVSDRFVDAPTGLTPMTATMAEADVAMALFKSSVPTTQYGPMVAGAMLGLTTPRPTSGAKPPGNFPDVAYHVQWAMPKEQVPAEDKRFTYLWIDAHSAHSQEEYFPTPSWEVNPFETTAQIQEYIRFIKQKSFRTQPMVMVHQTKADFTNQIGRTPRLYATISGDLMITELVYKFIDNLNFSVVELQNTSRLPINLDDYALVRLVSNGSKMQYRTVGGDKTDNLDEAELYPLCYLDQSKMIRGYEDKDGLEHVDGEDTPKNETDYAWNFTGDFRRPFNQFLVDGKKRLEAGQIVLLGSPCYAQHDATVRPWWSGFFPEEPRKRIWYELEKRFRYFIGCDTQVLNINTGTGSGSVRDGLALIKFCDQAKTIKKVIDTTAPIGASNLGFSGTFDSYRQELAKTNSAHYYTQKRKEGVVFPFMPPYRTVKATTDWSDDWDVIVNPASHTATDNSVPLDKQTLGHRWLASLDGANLSSGRRLKLDRGSSFTKKRTPLGRPDLYKNSRPVHR